MVRCARDTESDSQHWYVEDDQKFWLLYADSPDLAFEYLNKTYGRILLARAFRLSGNRADAEDRVQGALMRASAAFSRADYSWPVLPYLYRALDSDFLDEHRRMSADKRGNGQSLVPFPDEYEGAPSKEVEKPIEQMISKEAYAVAQEAIRNLPDHLREVLQMRLDEAASFPEIASKLNISLRTAHMLARRAITRVRNALAKWGDDNPYIQ